MQAPLRRSLGTPGVGNWSTHRGGITCWLPESMVPDCGPATPWSIALTDRASCGDRCGRLPTAGKEARRSGAMSRRGSGSRMYRQR